MSFREVDFISVPKGLPTAIINDNRLLKSVVVYYQLKSLYKSGVIKNYTKRYSELASHPNIKCSESKLRQYISILRTYGYVLKDKSNNLFIVSKNKLKEEFNTSKFTYKVDKDDICNLEILLKGLVLSENLERQKKNVIDKIVGEEYDIGEVKGYPDSKNLKKLRKFVTKDFDSSLRRSQARYAHILQNDIHQSMDCFYPFITLSRHGVARNLNRKSSSTGSRLIQKMKSLNYIECDDTNYIILDKHVSYNYYLNFRNNYLNNKFDFNPKQHIYFSKGRILLALANNIRIKQLDSLNYAQNSPKNLLP